VVGTAQGKQKMHLEHMLREHQSSTVPAPGDNCGGHHSRKAASAPLNHLLRNHQSGTVWHSPAPGDDYGGHHSGKAATAPGTIGDRAPF
jgi:hypothetical protein